MSKDIAEVKAALPVALAGLGNLVAATAQLDVGSSSQFYIKMSRSGEWIYGSEETEVQEGSLWAINPHQLQKGYIAWPDDDCNDRPSSPDEQMFNLAAGGDIPVKSDLPALSYKGSWSDQLGMQLLCTTGEDTGTQVIFKSNSAGGVEAIAALMQAIGQKIAAGDINCVPLVKLENSHYKHQKYGTIYKPKFVVEGWQALDGKAGEVKDTPDKVEEAAPEESAPAPRRRRRRVA